MGSAAPGFFSQHGAKNVEMPEDHGPGTRLWTGTEEGARGSTARTPGGAHCGLGSTGLCRSVGLSFWLTSTLPLADSSCRTADPLLPAVDGDSVSLPPVGRTGVAGRVAGVGGVGGGVGGSGGNGGGAG